MEVKSAIEIVEDVLQRRFATNYFITRVAKDIMAGVDEAGDYSALAGVAFNLRVNMEHELWNLQRDIENMKKIEEWLGKGFA